MEIAETTELVTAETFRPDDHVAVFTDDNRLVRTGRVAAVADGSVDVWTPGDGTGTWPASSCCLLRRGNTRPVAIVSPKSLPREPVPGDVYRVTVPFETPAGRVYSEGGLLEIVAITPHAPFGYLDPVTNHVVRCRPTGFAPMLSVWSCIRQAIADGGCELLNIQKA